MMEVMMMNVRILKDDNDGDDKDCAYEDGDDDDGDEDVCNYIHF